MRVDAHHHVWDPAVRDLPWTHGSPVLHRTCTADDLRPALLRNAIDATVVVQTGAVAQETAELLARAARDPHTRAVVGWADLTDPAVGDRLAALREGPGGRALVGLRQPATDEADPDWPARSDIRAHCARSPTCCCRPWGRTASCTARTGRCACRRPGTTKC
ncbi:amidohydrolase family protein [Streptomyces sp. NPDC060275]|uniref:amidohydrolase family protein n=1 Tax=Streptomyces sp. NPDC060275 TaxID=3347090 RepID=UPI003660F95D